MENHGDKLVVKASSKSGFETLSNLDTPTGYRVRQDLRGKAECLIVIPSNFQGGAIPNRRRGGGGGGPETDGGEDVDDGLSKPSSSSTVLKRPRSTKK